MKRIRADDQTILFQLSAQERDALLEILQTYPVVPPAHQTVSKKLEEPKVDEYQRLLEEALAEQRATNQRHLLAWLATPGRFQKNRAGYRFTMERHDSEWLLQVLNDVRVGHWLLLGSPEPGALTPENIVPTQLPAWLAMEMSGYFQMNLLEELAR